MYISVPLRASLSEAALFVIVLRRSMHKDPEKKKQFSHFTLFLHIVLFQRHKKPCLAVSCLPWKSNVQIHSFIRNTEMVCVFQSQIRIMPFLILFLSPFED